MNELERWGVLAGLVLGCCAGQASAQVEAAPRAEFDALRAEWRAGPGADEPELEQLVLRQLDAFADLERHPESLRDEVLALTRAPSVRLRLGAYRALASLRAEEVPLRALEQIVLDREVPDGERIAALRAWIRGPHPEVYVRLHVLARDVEHPAWSVALDGLAQLGDEYTLERLADLASGASDAARVAVEGTFARIRGRLAATTRASRVRAMLERMAWADLQCHSEEVALVRQGLDRITNWTRDEEVVRVLQELYRHYEPAPEVLSPVLGGSLRDRVRNYALRMLPD